MRKLIALPALAFALMLLLPGAAQTDPALTGQLEADYIPAENLFRGTLTGEYLSGWIEIGANAEGWAAGKSWHVAESWSVKNDNGDVLLAGTDEGVVSPNGHFAINGVVTQAGPGYEHLMGRPVHADGFITWTATGGTASGTFTVM